jgi:hypothetical protein
VTKDNTVHDHLQRLQIPQDPHRFHDAKAQCGCTPIRMESWPCSMGLGVWQGRGPRATAWANPGRSPGQEADASLGPAARSSIVDHI